MERTSFAAAPNPSEATRRTSGAWTAVVDSSAGSRRSVSSALGGTGVLVAPARLVSETRASFRHDALAFVETAARDSRPSIDLDLGQTVEIDAGGLGILILAQRRARALGLPTRLLHAREQVRRLLTLTKLDYLFQFVD